MKAGPALVMSPAEAALVDAAWEVRKRSICTYSRFAVGVALEDETGQRFTGANVENASYNLGLCAERVALYYALTHGVGPITRMAIVTEASRPTYPCGACRQALYEFATHAELILATRKHVLRSKVRALLPHGFDDSALHGEGAPTV